MQVIKAKTAGFCFGVKRAVDTVYEQVRQNSGGKIYTYGPIIHNGEVVRDLEEKGVIVLNSREELETLENGTVIIRSHGVTKDIFDIMQKKNLKIIDATCPFVKKAQIAAARLSKSCDYIVILGESDHPEVKGIVSYIDTPYKVIESAEEASALDYVEKYGFFFTIMARSDIICSEFFKRRDLFL